MIKSELLPRLADPAATLEEKLLIIAQVASFNGLAQPLDPNLFPSESVVVAMVYGDLALYSFVSRAEANLNPRSAEPYGVEMWRLGLTDSGNLDPDRNQRVCAFNGTLTKVESLHNPHLARKIVAEWTP